MNGIGERLRDIQSAFGLTQRQMAARAGVHINSMQNYQAGKRIPDGSFLEKICREFSVPPRWLLVGEGGMLPGAGDEAFRVEFSNKVVPAIEHYAPQALIISAGFDAHADDPVGNLDLSDETFSWMTLRMLELAERFTQGRLLSVLEGGYHLDVLGRCVAEHVRLLSA